MKSTIKYFFITDTPLFYLILVFVFIIPSIVSSQTWWHTYRNPGEIYQFAYDICKSDSVNFFIIGKKSAAEFARLNVLKVNKYGNILWSYFYFDSTSNGITGMACASSNDGGCVLSGLRGDNRPFSMKINSNGNLIWNKTYEGHNIFERTVQIEKVSDAGYLLCGLDYLLKIDSNGNYLWSKTDSALGYTIGGDLFSATESINGGYLCLGSLPFSFYPTLTKVDINGNVEWQKTYTNNIAFTSLIRKLSNGYLLMGTVPFSNPPLGTNYKYCFVKVDTAGTEISFHSGFDSTGKIEYFNRGMHILDDNRFLFTSIDYTNYSTDSTTYTVFKIVDSIGVIKHKSMIVNNHWGGYEVYSALPLQDGYIMYTGKANLSSNSNNLGVFMARTDSTLYINPVFIKQNNENISENFKLFQNFPNPFNSRTKIRFQIKERNNVVLRIFDVTGKEIHMLINEIKSPGIYEFNFEGNSLSSGIYFYRIVSGSFTQVKRMVLIK